MNPSWLTAIGYAIFGIAGTALPSAGTQPPTNLHTSAVLAQYAIPPRQGASSPRYRLPEVPGGRIVDRIIPQPSAAFRPPLVTSETYKNVTLLPDTVWSSGVPNVLTYVLAGAVGGDTYIGLDAEILQARENLKALITEIRAMPAVEELTPDLVPATHLFCIPTKASPSQHYDYVLSTKYRLAIMRIASHEMAVALDRPGPFLVAMRLPYANLLNAPLTERFITLIDLSGAEPKAVPIFIKTFKKAVKKDGVRDKELSTLRGDIASVLIRADGAVPFVRSAYAGVAMPSPAPASAAR